jgi:hypothetical protein
MGLQHKHRHAAWAWACIMGMNRQHRHEHALWTWTCIMDMGMQHGHGHAAWTHAWSMDMGNQHGHRHAAWTWTCSMDMDMDMVLGDHCSIVALFNAFESTFSLFLQSFQRKGRRWWPLWSSQPLSQARIVSWLFYYKDNAVVKAMGNFQTAMTVPDQEKPESQCRLSRAQNWPGVVGI